MSNSNLVCLLCEEREDGIYARAISQFENHKDLVFANQLREQAGETGRWIVSHTITNKPFASSKFPFKVC